MMAPGDGIKTSSDPALILHFVCAAMTRRFTGPVQTVQTDDGPEFKGRFAQQVLQYYVRHRIARPHKKKAQPTGRVSTGPCGRNAWGGPPIGWKSFRPSPPRDVHSWSAIIIIARIFGITPMRTPLGAHCVAKEDLSDIYGQ